MIARYCTMRCQLFRLDMAPMTPQPTLARGLPAPRLDYESASQTTVLLLKPDSFTAPCLEGCTLSDPYHIASIAWGVRSGAEASSSGYGPVASAIDEGRGRPVGE
jgi:hypothetical protein